jgi:Holliday junction resolvase-like predicted endonuclease
MLIMLVMPELEKIRRQVLRGGKIEDAMGKYDWKEFEEMVGDIFRQNDFRVRNNFRFKTVRGWEMDLVAWRGSIVFCVDCKRWSAGRGKRSSLSKAAKDQSRRTKEFGKFIESNPIARGMMGIEQKLFVPVMATLHEESLLKEGDVFVVPVKKLNTFIVESDSIF